MSVDGLLFFLAYLGGKTEAKYRKYCAFCGRLIPREAAYCPDCGNAQSQQVEARKNSLSETISKNGRKIRFVLFFVSLALFLVAFFAGSQVQLSRNEALAMVKEFEEAIGSNPTAETIIMHNTALCLQFFIPVLGMLSLGVVGFSSGNVLAAIALSSPNPISSTVLILYTLATPVAWIEFVAYSLASSEGIMIIVSVFSRCLRKEARTFLLVLVASISLLVLGGFVEVFLIDAMQGQGL